MSIPLAYAGVVLIWSTTPLAIQWSGQEVGFLFGITSRMLLGVLAGMAAALVMGIRLPWHAAARRTYLAAGLGMFLAMLSVYWASQYIPSGWISVLFGIAPIVTGVMASRWLGERALVPTRIAGMLLGVAGLAIMLLGAHSLGAGAPLGIAGMVFSVTAYSASAVAVKRIGADIPALATTIGGLAVTVPLLLAVYYLTDTPLPHAISVRTAGSIVYLGIVGSVLGFAMYYYVLRHVEATRVALITLVTPVIALLLGHILNGEPLQPEVWAGTGAILSGLLLFEYGQDMNGWLERLLAMITPE
ncbi:MAG TPA: DMT family transporter [Gammaproteobacteria bacterium]|nr:DMT family transporter [Gammaproteobacteria bacterium]